VNTAIRAIVFIIILAAIVFGIVWVYTPIPQKAPEAAKPAATEPAPAAETPAEPPAAAMPPAEESAPAAETPAPAAEPAPEAPAEPAPSAPAEPSTPESPSP